MKLTLQDLYNYIFRNDWANPEFGISANLSPEIRAQQIKARKNKMKALFSEAISPKDLETFRAALRTAKATHLETILFGNTKDRLKVTYDFPREIYIRYAYLRNPIQIKLKHSKNLKLFFKSVK